jgi:branched-chain amino acid transport system substrate-binding protein
MNKSKKIAIIMICVSLLVLLLLTVLGGGCPKPTPAPEPTPTPTPTPTPEPVHLTVGAILPLSGPISFVGLGLSHGYELYYEKLNKEGGLTINGQQYLFDFILEDSRMDPEASATAATKLVHQDGADIVFGAVLETCTQAIYEITAPAGVLHPIANVNIPGHPADISPDKPLQVRPAINLNDSHSIILDYLVEAYPEAKTIAVIYPNLGYENIIENFTTLATERDFELVIVEEFDMYAADFVPMQTGVLATNPDIFWCMISGTSQQQLKTARDLGFTGIFVDDSPTDPDVHIMVSGPEYCTNVISAGMDISHPTEVLSDVIARWDAKYGEEFVSHCQVGWDAAWTITQAMEKAQSVDPGTIVATIETMTNVGDVQTVLGSGYISGLEDYGTNRRLVRPIPLVRIMNGEKEFIGLILPSE